MFGQQIKTGSDLKVLVKARQIILCLFLVHNHVNDCLNFFHYAVFLLHNSLLNWLFDHVLKLIYNFVLSRQMLHMHSSSVQTLNFTVTEVVKKYKNVSIETLLFYK